MGRRVTGGARRQDRLSVREYAVREGVGERTVWRWIAKGALEVVRLGVGRTVRIVVADSGRQR